MNNEEFSRVFNQQVNLCEDVLIDKAREYANDVDRLHNFRVAAALEGISMREALAGMMAKHTVSIYDMCKDPKVNSLDVWNEKITDHMNYLILLKALVIDEFVDTAQEMLHFPTEQTA